MPQDVITRAPRAEVRLRPMREADLPALHRLVVATNWPHRLDDCTMLLDLGRGVVASVGAGGPIGAGMWWPFGPTEATLGMVLVAAEHQGRGVGRALMSALLEEAGPRTVMLHATEEGLPLYRKLGFTATGSVRQHQGPAPPSLDRRPLERAQIRRAAPGDHPAILVLDESAFGASRAALLARLLADGEAWVAGEGERAAGFALRRPFGRGQQIGPVVAADEDTAIALIAAAAHGSAPGLLRVDVAADAERLADWLTAAGLAPVDAVTPMRRGRWPAPDSRMRRFALALQAVG
jgi:GNAT superfamily N-acetyltransferase